MRVTTVAPKPHRRGARPHQGSGRAAGLHCRCRRHGALSARGARALSRRGASRRAAARDRGSRGRRAALRGDANLPIYPQGGNTGLCGGAVPDEDGRGIVLSLGAHEPGARARRRSISPSRSRPGVILADVQRAAAEADRLFPLEPRRRGHVPDRRQSLDQCRRHRRAALWQHARADARPRGRAAGRHASGTGCARLRKDNTGYDLKQLFIGGEGTLGIITAATLEALPAAARDRDRVPGARPRRGRDGALRPRARRDRRSAHRVRAHPAHRPRHGDARTSRALPIRWRSRMPWYVLMELSSSQEGRGLRAGARRAAGRIARARPHRGRHDRRQPARRRRALWRIREGMVEAQKHIGACIKHDVSVPVSKVADFILEASARGRGALSRHPHHPVRPCRRRQHPFQSGAAARVRRPLPSSRADRGLNRIVHDIAASYGGSISAEHGIGRLKRDELTRYKPAARARPDAPHQARARSRRHHESGQGHRAR